MTLCPHCKQEMDCTGLSGGVECPYCGWVFELLPPGQTHKRRLRLRQPAPGEPEYGYIAAAILGLAILLHFLACRWEFPDTHRKTQTEHEDRQELWGDSELIGFIHAGRMFGEVKSEDQPPSLVYDKVGASMLGLGLPALMICIAVGLAIWAIQQRLPPRRPGPPIHPRRPDSFNAT